MWRCLYEILLDVQHMGPVRLDASLCYALSNGGEMTVKHLTSSSLCVIFVRSTETGLPRG